MKKLFLCILVLMLAVKFSSAQRTPLEIGFAVDLFKTDYEKFAQKNQIGIEANYFVADRFTITGGYEAWSEGDNSIVVGSRFHLISPLYIRFRGLIKSNSDLSFGAGYVQSFDSNWRLKFAGDYFLNNNEIAARMGIAFRF